MHYETYITQRPSECAPGNIASSAEEKIPVSLHTSPHGRPNVCQEQKEAGSIDD